VDFSLTSATIPAGRQRVLHIFRRFILLRVRLPQNVDARLSTLCGRIGRTKEDLALEAIERHLERFEDQHDQERCPRPGCSAETMFRTTE
jgi:hypothetical protein